MHINDCLTSNKKQRETIELKKFDSDFQKRMRQTLKKKRKKMGNKMLTTKKKKLVVQSRSVSNFKYCKKNVHAAKKTVFASTNGN